MPFTAGVATRVTYPPRLNVIVAPLPSLESIEGQVSVRQGFPVNVLFDRA